MGKMKKQTHDLEEMLLGYLGLDSGFHSTLNVRCWMLDVHLYKTTL